MITCAPWSLHSRGYAGLSEFNPPTPPPWLQQLSVAQPAADADSRISCLCTRWAWLLITGLEIRRWSGRNWWWLWNNTNPIQASVLPQTDQLTAVPSPPSSHHHHLHWSTLIIFLTLSASYTRSLSHVKAVLCHLLTNGARSVCMRLSEMECGDTAQYLNITDISTLVTRYSPLV